VWCTLCCLYNCALVVQLHSFWSEEQAGCAAVLFAGGGRVGHLSPTVRGMHLHRLWHTLVSLSEKCCVACSGVAE
jgi:hypothetical protein